MRKFLKRKRADEKALEKAPDKLLRLVVEGEQDQVEEMIKKDKSLLLYAGPVTDLSGRKFKQITGFQYALWAMDSCMWKMFQNYLPEETQREQFETLETKGTEHGNHFSLQPLINALTTYLGMNAFDHRVTDYWCKVVGGKQKLLPAHVIHEYCCPDRGFYPSPSFMEDKLTRTRVVSTFQNPQAGATHSIAKWVEEDWFTASYHGGLCGDTWAFYRAEYRFVVAWPHWIKVGDHLISQDCVALQTLSKIRARQLRLLAYHVRRKPLITSTLLSVGLFKDVVNLVNNYAEPCVSSTTDLQSDDDGVPKKFGA
jgi:hypothetical protein